jgi:hypothetical protein
MQQAPAPRAAVKSEVIGVYFNDPNTGSQGPLLQTPGFGLTGSVSGFYTSPTGALEGQWGCSLDPFLALAPGQQVFESSPFSVVYTSNIPVTLTCTDLFRFGYSSDCSVTSMTLTGTTLKCGADSSSNACRNRFIGGGGPGSPSSTQDKLCLADAAASNLQLVTNCGDIQVVQYAQVMSTMTVGGRKHA